MIFILLAQITSQCDIIRTKLKLEMKSFGLQVHSQV